MIPFNPSAYIPQYSDLANQGATTLGEKKDAWARQARAREAQALNERQQDETERGNLVAEAHDAGQLGLNTSAENRLQADWVRKARQVALDLHRSGKVVEAEEVWRATGDEPPPWGGPQPLSGPAAPLAPEAGATPAEPSAMAKPPGLPMAPPAAASPAPPEPATEGFDMEFGVEEADQAMRAMPPAPPGMIPQHIPDTAPPAPPEPPSAPAQPPAAMSPEQSTPTAPQAQGMGSRLEQQYGNEVKSVQSMFDALAANEGSINQELANQVRAMAPATMDTVRQSGGTPKDAAEMLLRQYHMMAKGQYSLENTKLRATKNGGGGGGGGGGKGRGFGEDIRLFNEVEGIVEKVGGRERAMWMNDADGKIDNALSQAASANSLGQRQSIAGTVKSMFGGASSNQELNFVAGSGGISNKLKMWLNNYVEGGDVPVEMMRQIQEELRSAQKVIADRRAMIAQQAYDQVTGSGLPFKDDGERRKHAEWGANAFSRSGRGAFAPKKAAVAGAEVKAEDGETYTIQE